MTFDENNVEPLPWETWSSAICELRREVFIDEQGVQANDEWDDQDGTALHLGIVTHIASNKTLNAYARLLPEGKLTRMAVRRPLRKQGLGRQLVYTAAANAQKMGHQRLILDSQLAAVGFYEKLGFACIGDHFWDAGIEHIKMIKPL